MAHRGGDTWDRLLAEARSQFAAKGYHGAGVASIAKATGLTNAGLYHYLDNKEELLFAVLDEAVRDHLEVLEKIVADDLPPASALDRALENHLDFVMDKPAAIRVFLSERRFLTGDLATTYTARIKQYDALFEQILSDCLPHASSKEIKLLRFSVLGMINWVPEWYRPDGAFSKTAVRNFMKRSTLALITATGTDPPEG